MSEDIQNHLDCSFYNPILLWGQHGPQPSTMLQLIVFRLAECLDEADRAVTADKQNLDLMWSTELLALSGSDGASDVLERSVEQFMTSLLGLDQAERNDSCPLSEDDEPDVDSMTYSRSLSSLTVEHELTNRKGLGFSHKQCKILAPYFTYYKFAPHASSDAIFSEYSRIDSHEQYLRARSGLPDEPGFIDLSRHLVMSNCFFSISPEDAKISGIGMDSALKNSDEGSYAEDLQKILRRISELQAIEGTPAPLLVPLFVEADGNCLAHSLSRCLCGSQVSHTQ
jgi:hypothetical protein